MSAASIPGVTIEAFEAGQIDADSFDHEAHVYLAWLYLERLPVLDAVQRYLTVGLTVDEDFTNPPDHISAELEFMHILITTELDYLHKGCADEAAECLMQQYEFLNSHLGQWVVAFTDLTIKETHLPYFRYLAAITRQFIREDMQWLGETVADWRVRPDTIVK